MVKKLIFTLIVIAAVVFISFIFFPSQTKKAAQPLTGHTAFAAPIVNDFKPPRKWNFPQKTTHIRFLLRQA